MDKFFKEKWKLQMAFNIAVVIVIGYILI